MSVQSSLCMNPSHQNKDRKNYFHLGLCLRNKNSVHFINTSCNCSFKLRILFVKQAHQLTKTWDLQQQVDLIRQNLGSAQRHLSKDPDTHQVEQAQCYGITCAAVSHEQKTWGRGQQELQPRRHKLSGARREEGHQHIQALRQPEEQQCLRRGLESRP